MGIVLIWKSIVVSFGRQQNESSLQPRARGTPRATSRCGVLESAWSPDAQKSPRGVHRSPNRLVLSLLFLVETVCK